ncbi:MAG: hypothetical protein LBO69_06690 [Ignavibacteria bacterium]|jgi:hypothetical protein|nr:hypothetical protein [Ignavibacteria bacterium]
MLSGFGEYFNWAVDKVLGVSDDEYFQAVENCYSALCWNKYGSGWAGCPYESNDVGRVITAYVFYFTTHPEPDHCKYYYDEFSDRSDPYRKQLVSIIAQMASVDKSLSPAFVNDVLSYLYWGEKRGKVAYGILKPLQCQRFKDVYWYRNGIWKVTLQITEAVISFFKKVLDAVGHIIIATGNLVNGVANGAADLLNVTGSAFSYLPYILCCGVALVAGFEVYHYRKNGKIYVPQMDNK